ncbi:cation diffusion facilitator family transporter [Endozoicomonas sp. SM1973]|uniref:Cation diffusion facilitator family transporter n=1 Tax=Spartinivicinus marinus TaxID=2994442 RepID=A0A853I4I3_9GAMM|nr:cation diffusion facilitator family transporter [Spartinivicinus marinus]MCX4029607.1 cation diffusion facilitator family transporter [Spartinivicinus marinus]NYZ68820.1 cation diffusion facilitator family transporter [Spartinivicinus marinus]
MSHHCHHDHASGSGFRVLLVAFLITTSFMVVEIIGGVISGSLALIADAGHMLTDSFALALALAAIHLAKRTPDNKRSFGYQRFTTLAAFINAASLLLIVGWIFIEAVQRFIEPEPVMGPTMLVIAIVGFAVNLFAFWLLHRGQQDNINIRAATLHVLGDLLGSAAAIVAAIIIILTDWTPIDPILSVVVSLLVLRGAWSLLKETSHELLEGVPNSVDTEQIAQQMPNALTGVINVHHIHAWQLGSQQIVVTLHVHADGSQSHDKLLTSIHSWLYQQFGIQHATVQLEYDPCEQFDCEPQPSHSH